jgi:hypothetical protein
VNEVFWAEAEVLKGKVLVTIGPEREGEPPLLLAILEPGAAADDSDATELAEPLRLVDVEEVPPKPENPSVAGLDSSGKRRPVRVSFDSHMRR